ncbi:MAG: molybdopterin-guanine dinucleotide biosynthesis protein MobB [Oscillospiraceae bacterium]|nr:molybdopterin-guanine dinucleotide biosynthesis protein MobB [Oscillospiraceae bacterium]
MKVFTVIGISGSGKTTVVEAVVKLLRQRGYSVGSVKEIHYEAFAIDSSPTSNTHRHRAAGASLVTARGLKETDFLYPEKLSMKAILSQYKGYDWVALEGVSELSVPAVICAHDADGLKNKWTESAVCVSGKAGAELAEYNGLPAYNVLDNADGLCDFLEENVPDYLECFDPNDTDAGAGVTLTVDGKPVRMVPFVQKILRNAALGVVSELQGYKEGAEVEIRLK